MTVTLGQSLNGTNCGYSGIESGYYLGQIDEFYIYSKELTQGKVANLANP
jgi:hypothetical protein